MRSTQGGLRSPRIEGKTGRSIRDQFVSMKPTTPMTDRQICFVLRIDGGRMSSVSRQDFDWRRAAVGGPGAAPAAGGPDSAAGGGAAAAGGSAGFCEASCRRRRRVGGAGVAPREPLRVPAAAPRRRRRLSGGDDEPCNLCVEYRVRVMCLSSVCA